MKISHAIECSLLSLLLCVACVPDLSTTGEHFEQQNENTYDPAYLKNVMDEQQQKIMNLFYTGAEPNSGMAYNDPSHKSVLTTGATGFGIMTLIAGVERGWITREAAAEQIVKIVRFLKKADRFEGAWAHWYNVKGEIVPFGNQVQAGEIVETTFMMEGLLTACEYFTADNEAEKEIRETTAEFWNTINWKHYVHNGKFYWMWHKNSDTYELPLVGWNETLLAYILAMAAPAEHAVPVSVYKNCWQANGKFAHPGRKFYDYPLPLGSDYGAALFLAHYSFFGLDPRKMEDEYCFYWQQNQNHTMINRHYCVYDAPEEYAYNADNWGLTACAGCGSHDGYLSHDPQHDNGVLSPAAALGSFPYTPFYATQVLLNLKNKYPGMNGKYGFYASWCPSEKATAKMYYAMEHAPMAIMLENYRSGLLWSLLMKNEHVQQGLQLAGIHEPIGHYGFYLAAVNTKTNVCDLMRNPDNGMYEVDIFLKSGGNASLTLSQNNVGIYQTAIEVIPGVNHLTFFDTAIPRAQQYTLTFVCGDEQYTLPVALH